MLSLIVIPLHAKKTIEKSMSQEKINWQELDQEYFELWDWILKECDGDWTKTYQGRSHQKAEEYRTKQKRFGEICRRIDERKQPYYFCWLKTEYVRSWTRGRVPAAHPNFENRLFDLCHKNDSFDKIYGILSEIIGTSAARRYWLVSLLASLPESTCVINARQELEDARMAYRSRHLQYSGVFDHLLNISDDFIDAVDVLRNYLYAQLFRYIKEPVEVTCDFAMIKVDFISRARADAINDVAIEESAKFQPLDSLSEPENYKHGFFFFCETDFIYPHRRVIVAPLFQKFEDVAAIDYFYKCNDDNLGVFSRWASETTQVIDRWSPEHVDVFKNFFINGAECENAKWRTRFDAKLDSKPPGVAEKYLKAIYKIGESNSCKDKNIENPHKLTKETNTPDDSRYPLQTQAACGRGIPQSAVEAYDESIEWTDAPANVNITNTDEIAKKTNDPVVKAIKENTAAVKANTTVTKKGLQSLKPIYHQSLAELVKILPPLKYEREDENWVTRSTAVDITGEEVDTLRTQRNRGEKVLFEGSEFGMDTKGRIWVKPGGCEPGRDESSKRNYFYLKSTLSGQNMSR